MQGLVARLIGKRAATEGASQTKDGRCAAWVRGRYSARDASTGEIKLARMAGTIDATKCREPERQASRNRYRGIVWIHAVELISQQSSGGDCKRQPNRQSGKNQPECASQDQLANIAASSPSAIRTPTPLPDGSALYAITW